VERCRCFGERPGKPRRRAPRRAHQLAHAIGRSAAHPVRVRHHAGYSPGSSRGSRPAMDRPLQPPASDRGRITGALRSGVIRSPQRHKGQKEGPMPRAIVLRSVHRQAVPLFLLSLCGLCVFVVPCLADWPLFRGNALQTGVIKDSLPHPLEVRWKLQFKEGFDGAAAIVDGTVYVASFDQHLYALDLATKKEKWKYKGGAFKAPVSVHEGAVYVGDEDGDFHCVDAKTGDMRWTFETGGEISSGANFAGDSIIFGSGDQHLYCLSRKGEQ